MRGKPVELDKLVAVAHAYLTGHSWASIVDQFRQDGHATFSKAVLHSRLQQIRERTGEHSNVLACLKLLDDPQRFDLPRYDEGMIARRRKMLAAGMTYRQIAEAEFVSPQAISEHFRRHGRDVSGT